MTISKAAGFLAAFLPWLDLKQPASVIGVTFMPLKQETNSLIPTDLCNDLRKILSGCVDIKGRPVRNPTVVLVEHDHVLSSNLREADQDKVPRAVNFLMLAAFACNEYFTQMSSYVNSAAFEAFLQRFERPPEWFALTKRRRDGGVTDMGYRHGDLKFTAPSQIGYPEPAEIDESLLASISRAEDLKLEVVGQIDGALSAFRVANSDSASITPQQEVVWMASAFERLLDASSNAANLGKRFSTAFKPYGTVTLAEMLAKGVRREVSPRKAVKEEASSAFLHQAWIEELYVMRGMEIHGKPLDNRKWGWRLQEHLLMGAFVFPLLAKILLANAGMHALDAKDIGTARAVDKLLALERWQHDPEIHRSSEESAWGIVLLDEIFRARFQGGKRCVFQSYSCPGAPGLAVFETRQDDMEVRGGVAFNRSFSFAAVICLLRLKAARSRTEDDIPRSRKARDLGHPAASCDKHFAGSMIASSRPVADSSVTASDNEAQHILI